MSNWEEEALHFYQEQKFSDPPKDIQLRIAGLQHQQAIIDSAYEKTKNHYAQISTDTKSLDLNTEMLYQHIRQPISLKIASEFDSYANILRSQIGEQFKNFKLSKSGSFFKLSDLDEKCQALLTPRPSISLEEYEKLVTPPSLPPPTPIAPPKPIHSTVSKPPPPKRKYEEISDDEEVTTPPAKKSDFVSAKEMLRKNSKDKKQRDPSPEPEPKKQERKPFVSPLLKKEEEAPVKEPPAKKQKTGDKKKDISHLFEDGKVPEDLEVFDPILVETIFNEIMHKDVKVKWDDVVGLEHAKGAVQEAVIWPLQRPEIFKGIRSAPKGLLLFGPPGTGKTMIGKAIACESNATFFSISSSSLMSKWVGEGEKLVRTLFAVARHLQPSVIFVDEIDSLLAQRSDNDADNVLRRMKTEFLVRLDGADVSADDRVLLIGATNRPQEIDEAVRRRMAKRLYIPLPNGEARLSQIKKLLCDVSHTLSGNDFAKIMDLSEGYSGSDLKYLCQEASLGPIRDVGANILQVDVSLLRPVMFKDFEKAFKQIRPSVDPNTLTALENWNKMFGSFH